MWMQLRSHRIIYLCYSKSTRQCSQKLYLQNILSHPSFLKYGNMYQLSMYAQRCISVLLPHSPKSLLCLNKPRPSLGDLVWFWHANPGPSREHFIAFLALFTSWRHEAARDSRFCCTPKLDSGEILLHCNHSKYPWHLGRALPVTSLRFSMLGHIILCLLLFIICGFWVLGALPCMPFNLRWMYRVIVRTQVVDWFVIAPLDLATGSQSPFTTLISIRNKSQCTAEAQRGYTSPLRWQWHGPKVTCPTTSCVKMRFICRENTRPKRSSRTTNGMIHLYGTSNG